MAQDTRLIRVRSTGRLGGLWRRLLTGCTFRAGVDFTQRGIGRCACGPTPVVGEVDDPLVEFLDGEITRFQRCTKVISKGAALTIDGGDRQRHESTVTTGEARPRPDPSHQVV